MENFVQILGAWTRHYQWTFLRIRTVYVFRIERRNGKRTYFGSSGDRDSSRCCKGTISGWCRVQILNQIHVLLCDEAAPRGHWSKAVVTSVIYDRDKVCRRVVVRTPNGKGCVRDIRKICVLECDV